MVAIVEYDTIVKYQVTAICKEPLHIGSAVGDGSEVLVHPVDEMPFVQASSIAGTFRSYYLKAYGEEEANELFGSPEIKENGLSAGSKMRFTDASFLQNQGVQLELRPRVKIDAETGTAAEGSKFNIEYIGAGNKIQFSVYLYGTGYEEKVEDVFAAMDSQVIQFGGQKSNGCGHLQIEKLLYRSFDMKNEKDRMLWFREEELEEKEYEDRKATLQQNAKFQNAYEITVTGKTEGELLVKSIVVTDYSDKLPDCMNMKNAKEEYIVPGSSFKGTIRSQMEKIAKYIDASDIIDSTFGVPEQRGKKGSIGNICFFDTVVGDKEKNKNMPNSYRIHIDKFTGGVIQQGLFSEKNVAGQVNFHISIQNRNHPERTCGLLLMALRDLAIGIVNVGSGYNVGKGIIEVEQIHLEKNGKESAAADIFFKNEKGIQDPQNLIEECLQSIRRE